MQLHNTFTVPATPDDAFEALLDLGRVAPCMPGAQLTDQDGDTYHGRLKLRIGPITAAYEGVVSVEHADRDARRAELQASGSEIGGQGGASAHVVATVQPDGEDGSRVDVVTDLDIRGRAAQFGRGAMGEVTQRVLDQFARNLEATFHPPPAPAAAPSRESTPAETDAATPPLDADLDVLGVVVGPLARQAAPLAGAFLVGLLLGRMLGRRSAPRAWPPAQASWPPPPWMGWQPPSGTPPGPTT